MTRFDYYCPNCKWFEEWANREDYIIPCPQCGASARRAEVSGIPAANTETVGFKNSKQIERE